VHAFKDAIEDLNSKENKQFHSFYEHYEYRNQCYQRKSRTASIQKEIIINDAKYYICGPELFIKKQYQSLVNLLQRRYLL
jgi:nitric oxide dioxygenase